MNNPSNGFRDDSEKKSSYLIWVMASFMVIALIATAYVGMQNKALVTESSALTVRMDDLDAEKLTLEKELGSLDTSYNLQIAENEKLVVNLEERLVEVESLKARVSKAKQKLVKSEEKNVAINQRLVQLEDLKDELESDIVSLNETNTQLVASNERMANELQLSKEESEALTEDLAKMNDKNVALVSRLYTIAPAGFIADNFSVTAAKRNNKLTAKARQAEHLNISFDLRNVPSEYQKDEELYLVLTKFDGTPVANIETKDVEVSSKDPISIKAAGIEKATLQDRQNIAMDINTERDLESGLYNVLVYADHGFLGATSFQLQ